MLVKIKPMFGVPWIRSDKIEEYVGIYMDQVHIPRAGERWFTVFHNGELKEVLDYEVYEVLIETL